MLNNHHAINTTSNGGHPIDKPCNRIWNGEVKHVKMQQQANGETVMRLYLQQDDNHNDANHAEYTGYTCCNFMADALRKAKDKAAPISGYTDANGKIQWIDFGE